jgi:hypothetical protein
MRIRHLKVILGGRSGRTYSGEYVWRKSAKRFMTGTCMPTCLIVAHRSMTTPPSAAEGH